MKIERRPRVRDLVLFVFLHVLIFAACGVVIWHVAAPLVGSWVDWVGQTMSAHPHNAGGLLIVLVILAMSAEAS